MTIIALVHGPGTQIPVGRIRIEAELSGEPRWYWQGHHDWRWFEADGLAEATARAMGHRDLSEVDLPDDEPGNMTDVIMSNMEGIERHDARLLARTILAHGYRRPE